MIQRIELWIQIFKTLRNLKEVEYDFEGKKISQRFLAQSEKWFIQKLQEGQEIQYPTFVVEEIPVPGEGQ